MINRRLLLERLNVELDVSEEVEVLKKRVSSLEELNEELNDELNELNADLDALKETKEQFIDFLNWIEGVESVEIKVEALRLLRGLK